MLKRVREHPDETGIFRRLTRKIGIPIAAADKKHSLRGEPPTVSDRTVGPKLDA